VKSKHRAPRHLIVRVPVILCSLGLVLLTLPGQLDDLVPASAGGGSPLPSASPSATPSPSPTALPSPHPFGDEFRAYLSTRSSRVGAALLDLHNGTEWLWHPHQTFNTGSIVKIQIAGTLMHDAQVSDRALSQYEQDNMVSMIEQSDNDSATNLWNEVGGTVGVGDFNKLVGMSNTTPDYHWGLTTTTAPDNVRLIRSLVQPSKLYDTARQQYVLDLMEHVTDWQRWGVSAGAWKGTIVALKNGWLPESDQREWIVNSIGWISGKGRDYILAVLTDESSSQQYGIDTIERVSRIVWRSLRPVSP
jgi:hypothetical protein